MDYCTQGQRRLAEVLDQLKIYYAYKEDLGIFCLNEPEAIIYEEDSLFSRKKIKDVYIGKLMVLHTKGMLSTEDGEKILVKYCNQCNRFYLAPKVPKKDDCCPKCQSSSLKYLSNNGVIPGWFGKNPDSIIDDTAMKEHIESISDLEVRADVRGVISKLRGTPSYMVVDGEKIRKLKELNQKYPNMTEVIEYIIQNARTSQMSANKAFSMKPIVLVGGPGCGKTSFTTILSTILMGKKPIKIDLGNDIANFTISGSDPTFKKAKHGLIVESMFADEDGQPLKNPIIHFDELDKVKSNNNHSVESVFYALLEKSNSRSFYDNFLGINVDASGINYILTANTLETVPAPIINRLRVFQIPDYTEDQLRDQVLNNFYENWLKNNNMDRQYLPQILSDEIKNRILREAHNDPRSIEDAISKVFNETLTEDSETNHPIALFSPEELYKGWKNFRGIRSISTTPWHIPENFFGVDLIGVR